MKQKVFWSLAQAFILVWLFVGGQALASESVEGSIVLAPDGTIYLISQNQKRGFPTPAVFHSHGYEFTQTIVAAADDLTLPQGPIMIYADGTLVKGSDPTVYLISNSEKRPFPSAEIFRGLGYSFANVITDSQGQLANLPLGLVISSSVSAHPAGTLVNDQGTVYLITFSGKQGIPSVEVFNSYGYKFKNAVLANPADKALAMTGLLAMRSASAPPAETLPETPTPPATPSNHPPVVPTISGYVATFPVTDATFTISATDEDGDNLTYTLDWGDGSEKIITTQASGETWSATHNWSYINDYTISVTADDGKGGMAKITQIIIVDFDSTRFGRAVTLTNPNGGAKYTQGQEIKITWQRNWMPTGAHGKVDIYYSRGGVQQLIKSGAEDKSYGWVPLGLIPADDYKIVITSQGVPGSGAVEISDESDNFFTLESVLGAIKRSN